jgi:hypothetical protein
MNEMTLKILFDRILVPEPTDEDIDRLKNFPDRAALSDFLAGKVEDFLREDMPDGYYRRLEKEVTAAVFMLGVVGAEETVPLIVDLLESVKEYPDTGACASAVDALKRIGEAALEPVHEGYLRDRRDDLTAMIWVDVLSGMGVKDLRIKTALMEYFGLNPSLATQFMADYGDQFFLPLIERYVESLAELLNENGLDPFEGKDEEEIEPLAADYLDAREALVLLTTAPDTEDDAIDTAIEELDKRLLKHSKFGGNGNGNQEIW